MTTYHFDERGHLRSSDGAPEMSDEEIRRRVEAFPELQDAIADLLEAFTNGKCYETKNPYARPCVQRGLRALGYSAGISTFGGDWLDVLKKYQERKP